jgi:hypothetical protein
MRCDRARDGADGESRPGVRTPRVYSCLTEQGQDRFVAIAVCSGAQWLALARATGRDDWAGDADLTSARTGSWHTAGTCAG